MHPRRGLMAQDFDNMEDMYLIQFEDELFGHGLLESYAAESLDGKCSRADIEGMVANRHHLTVKQQCDVLDVLWQHQKLFDGSLGVYPHKNIHIDK
jgi:hypothetical protein